MPLLIVDNQAKMATVIRRLSAPFLLSDELVAKIDESHCFTLPQRIRT